MNKHTELLRLYNQWRRGDIEQLDFTAKEIGEAIDGVLEERAEMLDALEMGISTKTANEAVRRCAEDVARYVVAKAKGEWPKESRDE